MDGDPHVLERPADLERWARIRRRQARVGNGSAGGRVDAAESALDRGIVAEPATADEEMADPGAEPLEAAEHAVAPGSRPDQVDAPVLLEVAEAIAREPVVTIRSPVAVLVGILEVEHVRASLVGIQGRIRLVRIRQIVAVSVDGQGEGSGRGHAGRSGAGHGDRDLAAPVVRVECRLVGPAATVRHDDRL